MPVLPANAARYPADWHIRRRFILLRAGNRCEWCRAANYAPHPVTGSRVVLTIAHLYDHRPEAADLLNLAALCQLCHNRLDAPRRAAGRRERRRLAAIDAGQMVLI